MRIAVQRLLVEAKLRQPLARNADRVEHQRRLGMVERTGHALRLVEPVEAIQPQLEVAGRLVQLPQRAAGGGRVLRLRLPVLDVLPERDVQAFVLVDAVVGRRHDRRAPRRRRARVSELAFERRPAAHQGHRDAGDHRRGTQVHADVRAVADHERVVDGQPEAARRREGGGQGVGHSTVANSTVGRGSPRSRASRPDAMNSSEPVAALNASWSANSHSA